MVIKDLEPAARRCRRPGDCDRSRRAAGDGRRCTTGPSGATARPSGAPRRWRPPDPAAGCGRRARTARTGTSRSHRRRSREIRWGQSQQDIGQQPGQSQTAHATHRPQRQSLCEQLGDQAAPSGAEGEPDGELAFARRTPREQEQRDVDGRDDPGTTRRPSESPRRRWWDRCRRIAPGPHGSCGGGWRRMTRSRAF
jgi:hypothetical protein